MKFAVRSRPSPILPGVLGPARVHRRTASLLGRLHAGDIAVLDHVDMDRDTAQSLIDAGVVAVVNASPMISGRYPNLGPERLVEAGVLIVDSAGPEIFDRVKDGTQVRLDGGVVYVGDTLVAPASPRSWTASPTTAPSSCVASRTCSCTGTGFRGPPPRSPDVPSSSRSGPTAGSRSCAGSSRSSASSAPSSSASTAERTRWPAPDTDLTSSW